MNQLAKRIVTGLIAVLYVGAAFANQALWTAAENGDVKQIQNALRGGKDVNAPDADQYTALLFAATAGKLAAVNLLLAYGADVDLPNNQGQTPLMGAALMGHFHVVKSLLKAGAASQLRAHDGRTALDYARQKSHGAVVDLLSPKAADAPPLAHQGAGSVKQVMAPAVDTPSAPASALAVAPASAAVPVTKSDALSPELIRQYLEEQDVRGVRIKEIEDREAVENEAKMAIERQQQEQKEKQAAAAQCVRSRSDCIDSCDTSGGEAIGALIGGIMVGRGNLSASAYESAMAEGNAKNKRHEQQCESICRSRYRCN